MTLRKNVEDTRVCRLAREESPQAPTQINEKSEENRFWTSYLSGLTKNTVIDARACKGGMDTDQGAS